MTQHTSRQSSVKATDTHARPVDRSRQGLSAPPWLISGLILGTLTPGAWAAGFSEAELFYELNNTDGDLGIHAAIDGGPYTELEIEGPDGRSLLMLEAEGPLADQGLTQLFLESAEPTFEELSPTEFFRRFPEGVYEIEGKGQTGDEFGARVRLSQVMAAPPANIRVLGLAAARNCDAAYLPEVAEPVLIEWDPVTHSHPEIGKPGPIDIVRYQFFVEREGVKFSADLPPSVTAFEVPRQITALGDEFKFEIIARTATGNNTAIESCFTLVR